MVENWFPVFHTKMLSCYHQCCCTRLFRSPEYRNDLYLVFIFLVNERKMQIHTNIKVIKCNTANQGTLLTEQIKHQ